MLDRPATLSVAAGEQAATLTRRRALFAVLVASTMAAVLWLAAVAVPPHSFGAIAFLVLFTVTLPWSVIGFWNAAIGFLIMRLCRDPATAVNPLAGNIPLRRIYCELERQNPGHVPPPRGEHRLQGRQHPRFLRSLGRQPHLRRHTRC